MPTVYASPSKEDFFSQLESVEEPQQQNVAPQQDFFSQLESVEETQPQKTNVWGAIGDIGKGLLNVPVDTAASVASIIDDPYTEDGTLDRFIELLIRPAWN